MTDEEPLDIQVARALGWKDYKDGYYTAHPPYYSTDWSATGPLIEKYSINLDCEADGSWTAFNYPGGLSLEDWRGKTPLEAICNLIIALGKAGKL